MILSKTAKVRMVGINIKTYTKLWYKFIHIINYTDNLPDDYILLCMKNMCIEYLENTKENWICVNLDNGEIKTKNE